MDFARKLEQKGATILFVSHNMFQIKNMCERVIYLKKGAVAFDGPTDEGLRRYEDDCRLAPAPWFSAEDNVPSVTVSDVSLRNEAGEEQSVFAYGERLRIVLTYDAPSGVEAPDVRIGINRQDDLHCCSFSTVADGVALPALRGSGQVELLTPPLHLVSDRYTATIAVREKTHGRMVCALLGATFHIKHPVFTSETFGVFHDPGQWTIRPDQAAASGQRSITRPATALEQAQ
jgi:lipopolysaccharide transport system ATP-binding protein